MIANVARRRYTHELRLSALCCTERPHLALGLCSTHYPLFKRAKTSGSRYAEFPAHEVIVATHAQRKLDLIAARHAHSEYKISVKRRASGKFREQTLKKRYGLTLADYDLMLASQNGTCFICEVPPGPEPLYVDHCHVTKRVRGLLCPRCNTLVGYLEKRADLFPRAREYLRLHAKGDSVFS